MRSWHCYYRAASQLTDQLLLHLTQPVFAGLNHSGRPLSRGIRGEHSRLRKLAAIGRFVALLAALVPMTACKIPDAKPDAAFYECRPSRESDDPERFPRPSPSPVVKIIELNELGELVDRCQWTDILYEMQRVQQPEMIVLYVHGWKHDAAEGDADRKAFTKLIVRLSKNEQGDTPRHVVGIFVGWPAVPSNWPIVREFTFWSTMRAADRVSQSATLTKLVSAIESVRRRRANERDYVVLMGHSFGARILFTATSQLLIREVQLQHPGVTGGTYGLVRGPADLEILLNPALEASVYTALDTIRRSQENFHRDQPPLLLTVSTSNDLATTAAFGIGQRFGLQRHERQLTTLGNYEPYTTHRISLRSDPAPAIPSGARLPWYDDFCSADMCLTRLSADRQPGNPFMVATTSKEILNGHGGIWESRFQDWLEAFIREADERARGMHAHSNGRSDCEADF
jgi:hypothetical protein